MSETTSTPPDCDRGKNICRRPPYCAKCQAEIDLHVVSRSPVSRDGSRLCRSGSIASGGWRTYCTCDTCF